MIKGTPILRVAHRPVARLLLLLSFHSIPTSTRVPFPHLTRVDRIHRAFTFNLHLTPPPPTYGFTFDRTGAVVNRDRKSPSLAATIVLRVHRSSIRVPEIRVIPSIFPLIEPADWPVAEPNELKFRLIIFALACRGRGPPTRDETRTRRGVAREKFRPRSLLDPTMKFLGETGGFVDGWMERGGGYIYIYILESWREKKKKSCKWDIGKGPTPRRTRHCHLAECPRTHGKLQSA